jgi:propionyl-CoA carboxylase alpha chain
LWAVSGFIFACRDIRQRTWLQGGGSMAKIPQRDHWVLYMNRTSKNGDTEPQKVIVTKEQEQYRVEVNGTSLQFTAQWALEDPLVHVTFTHPTPFTQTFQYLDPLPLGFRLGYFGTKVMEYFISPHFSMTL